jgi:hypothetical protein
VFGGDILAENNLRVNGSVIVPTVGNVAIGTSSAVAKLDVEGGDIRAGRNLVALGNVGIGTTNATAKLDVAGGDILAENNLAVNKTLFVSGHVGMGSGSLFFPLDVGTGNQTAIHASNNSTSMFPANATLRVENDESGTPAAAIAAFTAPNQTQLVSGSVNGCVIDTAGGLFCTGEIAGGIAIQGAAKAGPTGTRLHTMQTPESWVEDFGSGRLVNGAAAVAFDATFARTVNTESYHVFLTPNGDCKGLFVGRKGPKGFEVRELGGGRSGVEFDYRVVAHRQGFEKVRLAANR